MKKAVIFSFLVFVFSGCTSPSITYVPYTNVVYPPKSKDSPLILEPSLLAKRQFTSIGHLIVKGRSWGSHYTSRHDVEKKFLSEALAKGADGVVDVTIDSVPYEYDSYVPGYTTYEPMTMHHRGMVWGAGSYNGYYFGTSATNVPIYHEGFTVHHSGVIHTFSGDLIILLDKDTFDH